MICRYCTQELMTRFEPCPICRKPFTSFDIGVYSGSLWLTSVRNIKELARNEGFNEYFQNQFNNTEASYLRILEVLELSMPHDSEKEKKARGKKKQKKKKDSKKLGIYDACAALGRACCIVSDFEYLRRYTKRAKDGYEEQGE
ncbi:hypothetical protein TL16_g05685 [Triparma laevis f. inornata]|uniref:Uncharacterized protein n=1 Tax=Triparma laevis f. inornata TaxID=1714386 RepID=A0A9W7AKH2_9STRA|nr:hypothetical protein TL16_g05685 [Triparma laevis f. inornata]